MSRLFTDTVMLKHPLALDRDRNPTYSFFIIRNVFLDGGSLIGQGQGGATRVESATLYIDSRYTRMEELPPMDGLQGEEEQEEEEETEEKAKNLPTCPQPSITLSVQEGDVIEKDGHTWTVKGIAFHTSVTKNFTITVINLE